VGLTGATLAFRFDYLWLQNGFIAAGFTHNYCAADEW